MNEELPICSIAKKLIRTHPGSNVREKQSCLCCGRTIYYNGICWRCKEEQKRKWCLALTCDELRAIILTMIENIKNLNMDVAKYSDKYDAIGDMVMLLAYHNINTSDIAEAACDKRLYSFPLVYRDASSDIRDRLINELLDPTCEDPGDIQTCLAWIGDEEVLKTFMRLETHPLPWREHLHVDPSIYAEAGGWSFNENSEHQDLVYDVCYSMHVDPDSSDKTVRIGKKRDDVCGVCGCGLIDILTLDGRDERLDFLNIDGILRIPICPWCGCFAKDNVVRYESDGTSNYVVDVDPYFKENNLPPEYLDEMDSNRYVLDIEPSPPLRAYGYPRAPTIGGMAEWVQDWIYMRCPDCDRKMKYLASIPWECISDGFEGTLYIEICTDCKTVKLLHQQT